MGQVSAKEDTNSENSDSTEKQRNPLESYSELSLFLRTLTFRTGVAFDGHLAHLSLLLWVFLDFFPPLRFAVHTFWLLY